MTEYPFAAINGNDIHDLRVERLRGLECDLVRVQLQMAEPIADVDLGRRHDELVSRMEVHRRALGLPPALVPIEIDGDSGNNDESGGDGEPEQPAPA